MRTVTLLVVGTMAAMGYLAHAHACDPTAGPIVHQIDPAMVGVDQTPPTLGKPMLVEIKRFDGNDGCLVEGSCGDYATALIAAPATDDMAAPHRIGYRLTVLTGSGFTAPAFAVSSGYDGSVLLSLNDQDIDFTLQMVAVDAAGNESAPQTVHIAEDTGFCSIARGQRARVTTLAIAAIVLAAAALRRPGRARRRTIGALMTIAAFAAVVAPNRAHACSFVGPTRHTIDPAMVGLDQTPPTLPQPEVAQINHFESEGCMEGNSCQDLVTARVTNLATDDTTSPDQIGYRFAVVAGTPPAGFSLPTGTARMPISDGSFYLWWTAGQDVDVTLHVFAVDAAGNQSAPRTLRIHKDTGGCSVGRRHPAVLTLAVVTLALAMAARRQRRQPR